MKVGAPRTANEQGVAGEHAIRHGEGIGIIGVTRCVDHAEAKAFDANLVAILHSHRHDIGFALLSHDGDAERAVAKRAERCDVIGMQIRVDRLHKLEVKLIYELEITVHLLLIWDVAFSPDGTVLASGFHDGTIALWNVASGKSLINFRAHDDRVFQVTFSPDGSLLASAGGDKSVALRDGKSGEMKRRLEGHTDIIEALDFTPDGTKLASGSADNTIRIWNVQTGELLRTIKGQSYTVNSVDFSPDGALIASAGWADGVTIWNVATGEKASHFSEHPHYVDRMAFAPDWSRAATATDNLLKIWDARSGELLHTLEHGPADWEIDEVRFSPDSSLVVSAEEHAIKVWDAASGALRLTITEPIHVVTSAVFSPDGSAPAIGGGAIKTLDLGRSVAKR
jgi:WD40 repeat protein